MLSSLFVCLSVYLLATLRKKNFRTDWYEICREGWQQADEQTIKFWWRSRSPSGCMDCFPDSSLLGDTESGTKRPRCATLQRTACTNGHHHSNYDVITSPADDRQPRQTCLGGGMHCHTASSLKFISDTQPLECSTWTTKWSVVTK